MKQIDTNSVLNRVVAMHARSLPVYLTDALPWSARGSEEGLESMKVIAEDQLLTVNRLADYIQLSGGAVRPGSFPMHFANWHDLSLEFLAGQAAKEQARNVMEIETLLPQLNGDPKAKALVEESLGAAKAHLDTLADLQQIVRS